MLHNLRLSRNIFVLRANTNNCSYNANKSIVQFWPRFFSALRCAPGTRPHVWGLVPRSARSEERRDWNGARTGPKKTNQIATGILFLWSLQTRIHTDRLAGAERVERNVPIHVVIANKDLFCPPKQKTPSLLNFRSLDTAVCYRNSSKFHKYF